MKEENENRTPNEEPESNAARRLRLTGGDMNEEIHDATAEIREGNRWQNFWYRYKWTVIIVSFFLVVGVILFTQLAMRQENDAFVMIGGPVALVGSTEEAAMKEAMEVFLAAQTGKKETHVLLGNTFYQTEEQRKAENREQYGAIQSAYGATEAYQTFNQQMMSGEIVIYAVDPSLYQTLLQKYNGGGLAKLSDVLGFKPAGACSEYGVYLKDTALGKSSDAFDCLPDDTILCIMVKLYATDQKDYDHAKDVFRLFVGGTPAFL